LGLGLGPGLPVLLVVVGGKDLKTMNANATREEAAMSQGRKSSRS